MKAMSSTVVLVHVSSCFIDQHPGSSAESFTNERDNQLLGRLKSVYVESTATTSSVSKQSCTHVGSYSIVYLLYSLSLLEAKFNFKTVLSFVCAVMIFAYYGFHLPYKIFINYHSKEELFLCL